ncbi:MAG: transporter substrate-binding protein [Deltaproteobacteria bacterium]|nr:transporter substrate-binding protein [Deltaproteobacteria bacterium]
MRTVFPCRHGPTGTTPIGWSAIAGSQAPFWITKEAGLFEKNGLDSGSRATQAMMSGDLPIARVGGNAPVAARWRGADITLVGWLLKILAYNMVLSPEIKKPEDFRGKKHTVSRFGPNSDYATRKILLKWGLRPDIAVAVRQIPGGQPTRLATIQSQPAHGMVAQPPVTNLARKFNMNIIAEPEDFGAAYPTTPVAARVWFIKDKRETVRKCTRALLEGIHVYKTQKDFSKKETILNQRQISIVSPNFRIFSTTETQSRKPYLIAIRGGIVSPHRSS